MPLRYIGKVPGFSQRTDTQVNQTKDFPTVHTGIRLIRDLFEFDNKYKKKPDSPMLKLAIAKAFDAFKLAQPVPMLHLNDLFRRTDLDIWNKSPGRPWRDCGYKTKGDIARDPEAVRRVRYFWHLIKGGDELHPPDCLACVRSHVCDIGESKVHAVWTYPATITFGEAMFCVPLIEAYKERDNPIAYGFKTARGGMKKICDRFGTYKKVISLDFKKFDKTVPVWLINTAFKILMYNVDFVNYRDHGVADARNLMHVWDYLRNYFINTTIRTANGCRFRKDSGIASGSYFTQLIGSVCTYILCQWMCLEQNCEFALDIIVQGDDSLMAINKDMSLNECDKLMQTIGMKINIEKSQVTYELQTNGFLRYRIGNGCPSKDQHSEIELSS